MTIFLCVGPHRVKGNENRLWLLHVWPKTHLYFKEERDLCPADSCVLLCTRSTGGEAEDIHAVSTKGFCPKLLVVRPIRDIEFSFFACCMVHRSAGS